jgi:hypothetical protein
MRKSGKGKLKRAHVLSVLEQGYQDVDNNLAAMLDMPLLYQQVAHGNLIKLKLASTSFVSSTLATRDSWREVKVGFHLHMEGTIT